MKISRLSSTEVANTASLPYELREQKLLSIEKPFVNWGYQPIVDALPKLLLADGGLFGHLPADDDEVILASIMKACRSPNAAQKSACAAVAEAIIEWRKVFNARGIVISPDPLRLTVDTLRYCADVAVVIDETLYVINLDPRSTLTLTPDGREFMKSLIHHTALIGDLRAAKPAILRVPRVGSGRRASLEVLSGKPKYSMEELIERVQSTYALWEVILRRRQDEAASQAV